MPQENPPTQSRTTSSRRQPPTWTQEPLLLLDDGSLRKSALIRVGVYAVLNGSTGSQEIGYEIMDLATDTTLALAHNVTPGDVWDNSYNYGVLAHSQHQRARRLLLPF